MYYWITLPVTITFIVNGVGHLYFGYKLNDKFPKEHNFYDSIMTFILWIIAGILYPLYYATSDLIVGGYLYLATFIICLFTPFMLFLILNYQKKEIKKDPSIRERRNIKDFLANYDNVNNFEEHSYKTDLTRKALHLFPAGMIIFLWIFAINIWGGFLNGESFWGISPGDFGKLLILTVGYSGIIVFATLDYVRLSAHIFSRNLYHLLPDNVLNMLGKAIKRKELFEFTKPATLVMSFACVFFFPFPIFCAAALIATLGDGAASVFGKAFGKTTFPKNSSKTRVGYIAGFLASFGVSFFSVWLFGGNITLLKIAIISISGALVFLIIDLLNLNLDDNILNPVGSAIVMYLLYIFIFV